MATDRVKVWLKQSGLTADDVKIVGRGSVYLKKDAIEGTVRHYRSRPISDAKKAIIKRARDHEKDNVL